MISIILTGYKEQRTIGRAIEQILDNKIKGKYEILVLAPDNETLEAARVYSTKNDKIKVIGDKGKGKPAALNLAFSKSKGDILVLTDADVFIAENAISNILKPFKNPKIGAVSGHPLSTNDKKTMLGFWSHLLVDIAHRIRQERYAKNQMIVCSGYLYAFRKKLIKNIPEDVFSEDAVISHLIAEKGYGIAYAGDALVFVKYPLNFKDWIIQKRRSAGGYNQLKYLIKTKERMRSFAKESAGIFKVLSYPKTIKQFFYTVILVLARIYLWILIYVDINLKKKEFKKIWKRVESTK